MAAVLDFQETLRSSAFPSIEEARDNANGFFPTERGAASGILAANLVPELPQFGQGDDRIRGSLLPPLARVLTRLV